MEDIMGLKNAVAIIVISAYSSHFAPAITAEKVTGFFHQLRDIKNIIQDY